MAIIRTPRFTLRRIRQSDAEMFAHACNDPLIARNTARIPHPYTLDDARAFVARAENAFDAGEEYAFAVFENDRLVACSGIMTLGDGAYELGYWVAADARGKGAATEAARGVVAYGFERRGAARLEAGHFADNPASGRILERIGFRYTGEKKQQNSVGRGCAAQCVRMMLPRDSYKAPKAGEISIIDEN